MTLLHSSIVVFLTHRYRKSLKSGKHRRQSLSPMDGPPHSIGHEKNEDRSELFQSLTLMMMMGLLKWSISFGPNGFNEGSNVMYWLRISDYICIYRNLLQLLYSQQNYAFRGTKERFFLLSQLKPLSENKFLLRGKYC